MKPGETAAEELKRLRHIEALLNGMFKSAEKQNLFIGVGRKAGLPESEQEGPMVKKMRKLLKRPEPE